MEDFQSFIDKLEKRSEIIYVHDVKVASWGQQSIRFYDLDGHLIEVGEELKSVISRFQVDGLTLEEISVKMDISLDEIHSILQQ